MRLQQSAEAYIACPVIAPDLRAQLFALMSVICARGIVIRTGAAESREAVPASNWSMNLAERVSPGTSSRLVASVGNTEVRQKTAHSPPISAILAVLRSFDAAGRRRSQNWPIGSTRCRSSSFFRSQGGCRRASGLAYRIRRAPAARATGASERDVCGRISSRRSPSASGSRTASARGGSRSSRHSRRHHR